MINTLQTIGNTPLLTLDKVMPGVTIFAKWEACNPGGSVKDRPAIAMVEAAVQRGQLPPGGFIVEATSGNTGIGLSLVAAVRGFGAIFTMPETMSKERQDLLKARGARVVLTPAKLSMQGAVDEARRIARETPGAFYANQFENPDNPRAHFQTTGPEIYNACPDVHAFVAGVGTGGTISGVGRYLRQHRQDVRLIAVEPASSPVLSTGVAGQHRIQGIGAGFVPKALDRTLLSEVVTVSDEDALQMARTLAEREGLLCGISAGANVFAALSVARRSEYQGLKVVTILPDTGERYLSIGLFGA